MTTRRNRAARIANKQVLPRIQKLSPLCITSLLLTSPDLPVPPGVSGGGAALSSLCRRFPGGDIMNLTSRRNPLSGLSFSPVFLSPEKEKRIGSDAVTKSLSAKQNEHLPAQTRCRATPHQSLRDSFPSRGSQSWNHAVRIADGTAFAPNTETFSAVHNISVVCLSRLARSPGGLGGRSRIEPRIST